MFAHFFTSTADTAVAVSRAVAKGEIRRIRRGLYTTDLITPLPELVQRHLWEVVRLLFPGHVIGYRTALELRPSPESTVHLVGSIERRRDVEGLKIWCHQGTGPIEGDRPYMGSLYLASRARAFLECLRPSRAGRRFGDKALSRTDVEERLDHLLRLRGETELNRLRDDARSLRDAMDAHEEFRQLDGIIGALLRTRHTALASPIARARALERPYDPDRLILFQELHRFLAANPLGDLAERHAPGTEAFSKAAFFDSYFSNWIEGTEFGLDEAREIVTSGRIPQDRPADGHDVLGTFDLVSDTTFMTGALGRSLSDTASFIGLLHEAHRRIMSGRPEMDPGQFKVRPNRAGTTLFVDPTLVEGTLHEALGLVETLPEGMCRAAYLMFVISEVHPYADGNGRVARAVMNAALVSAGQVRVIIVSGYRDDYLRALKTMSQRSDPLPYTRMLARAQRFMAELPIEDYEATKLLLQRTGALDDTGERRLRLPSEIGERI